MNKTNKEKALCNKIEKLSKVILEACKKTAEDKKSLSKLEKEEIFLKACDFMNNVDELMS